MDQTTLTQADVRAGTVIALSYDNDGAGTGAVSLTQTTVTASWDATGKIFTITLDEETDGAFIPNGKFVSADLDTSVTDLASNAEAGAIIYAGSATTAESTVPTFTISGTSVNAAGDTIALTFNEVMGETTLTQADVQAGTVINLAYDDDGAGTNLVS